MNGARGQVNGPIIPVVTFAVLIFGVLILDFALNVLALNDYLPIVVIAAILLRIATAIGPRRIN